MSAWKLYVYGLLMNLVPPTSLFGFKRFLLRWCGARIGARVKVVSSAKFSLSGPLEIGDDSWIGHEVMIVGGGAPIVIGSKVDVGPRAILVSGTHQLFCEPDRAAGAGLSLPITVGDGAWIGAGALVLGGVDIGDCAVIAAGSVVTSSISERQIVGGVPAKLLRVSA